MNAKYSKPLIEPLRARRVECWAFAGMVPNLGGTSSATGASTPQARVAVRRERKVPRGDFSHCVHLLVYGRERLALSTGNNRYSAPRSALFERARTRRCASKSALSEYLIVPTSSVREHEDPAGLRHDSNYRSERQCSGSRSGRDRFCRYPSGLQSRLRTISKCRAGVESEQAH